MAVFRTFFSGFLTFPEISVFKGSGYSIINKLKKMKISVTRILIATLLIGATVTAVTEASVMGEAYGKIAATSAAEQSATRGMLSPNNYDTTCIRAQVAVRVAKRELNKAQAAHDAHPESEQFSIQLENCRHIYSQAMSLYKRVSVAKTETRMALKKFYVIEHKAKDAEKKAILAEEKAQLAKRLVTKYEKQEYVVRKCKQAPRHLTRVEKTIVKSLTKKVVKLRHKVTVIRKTIRKLTNRLP
jgi:hypothetical protein